MGYRASGYILLPLALIAISADARETKGMKGSVSPALAVNLMAKVPMTLGYYVGDYDKCSNPSSVSKYGPNSVTEISADSADRIRLASVERSENGYWLKFAGKFEEPDPTGIFLRPLGSGRIEVSIQDTARMHYCRPEELPAPFRK